MARQLRLVWSAPPDPDRVAGRPDPALAQALAALKAGDHEVRRRDGRTGHRRLPHPSTLGKLLP